MSDFKRLKEKIRLVLMISLLFVTLFSGLVMASNLNSDCVYKDSYLVSQVISDEPVVINNESDFVIQGWPGTGSTVNPYVIEGLKIDGANIAISIKDVTTSFIIRNCTVSGPEDLSSNEIIIGIRLWNVSNALVENCSVSGFNVGIGLLMSSDSVVNDCEISYNFIAGIALSSCTNMLVKYNHIGFNEKIGIWVDFMNTNNTFYGNFIEWNLQQNALDDSQSSNWDDGKGEGNMWSDYSGYLPYPIPGSLYTVDNYPRISPETLGKLGGIILFIAAIIILVYLSLRFQKTKAVGYSLVIASFVITQVTSGIIGFQHSYPFIDIVTIILESFSVGLIIWSLKPSSIVIGKKSVVVDANIAGIACIMNLVPNLDYFLFFFLFFAPVWFLSIHYFASKEKKITLDEIMLIAWRLSRSVDEEKIKKAEWIEMHKNQSRIEKLINVTYTTMIPGVGILIGMMNILLSMAGVLSLAFIGVGVVDTIRKKRRKKSADLPTTDEFVIKSLPRHGYYTIVGDFACLILIFPLFNAYLQVISIDPLWAIAGLANSGILGVLILIHMYYFMGTKTTTEFNYRGTWRSFSLLGIAYFISLSNVLSPIQSPLQWIALSDEFFFVIYLICILLLLLDLKKSQVITHTQYVMRISACNFFCVLPLLWWFQTTPPYLMMGAIAIALFSISLNLTRGGRQEFLVASFGFTTSMIFVIMATSSDSIFYFYLIPVLGGLLYMNYMKSWRYCEQTIRKSPTRTAIIMEILNGPRTTSELVQITKIEKEEISQSIRFLVNMKIISRMKTTQGISYQFTDRYYLDHSREIFRPEYLS